MNWWKPLGSKSGAPDSFVRSDRSQNPRRYPRVYLLGDEKSEALAQLFGAEAQLSDGHKTKVYDLSHSGIAFQKDGIDARIGDVISFRLSLANAGDFQMKGRVARVNDRVVAVDFEPLGAPERLALAKFLAAKTIGLSLRPVDRKFFKNLEEGFTHWLQGPDETNVFVRYDNLTLKAAQVTMGDDVLEWREGNHGKGEVRTATITDQGVTEHRGNRTVLMRILDMLSQAREGREAIDPLVKALMGAAAT
jgi:hypothetical protein